MKAPSWHPTYKLIPNDDLFQETNNDLLFATSSHLFHFLLFYSLWFNCISSKKQKCFERMWIIQQIIQLE